MKPILPLFIMVDACGWELIRHDPFGKGFAPTRKKLEAVFGYGSTSVPSIVSGRWPYEHRNWCYFVYNPKDSPFRGFRWLRWLPTAVTGRRGFRRPLTAYAKRRLQFRGFFDLYNIPFEFIHLFDFSEKKSPLQPGGMNSGPNIFDFLVGEQLPYFVTDPGKSEEQNRDGLIAAIEAESIDFAFQYWDGLDRLLHAVGNDSPAVGARLREYERWLELVLAAARRHYAEVRLYVFSDHGMANCDERIDLQARIDALPVRMEKDYAVVYESTMARFWFFNDRARHLIKEELRKVPGGRILPDAELRQMNVLFEDRHFGELIFLLREGALIHPSHMGGRPLRGMHGYHPTERHSYAALLTNQPTVPADITHVPHVYRLMVRDARDARAARRTAAGPAPAAFSI